MIELFTRLTSNSNEWIIPSGHPWKKGNQGKSTIPYENQYGFGHEEWLLNLRYEIKGYQYGYIRGLSKFKGSKLVDRVYLFTVKTEMSPKAVFYIGYINNVEILEDGWQKNYPDVYDIFNEYSDLTRKEVENSNGDVTPLKDDPFQPMIRFQKVNAFLLDDPVFIEHFPLYRYKRFQPYKITKEILDLFNSKAAIQVKETFEFNPGKARQSEFHNRYTSAKEKAIFKTHSKIVKGVEHFLRPDYSISKKNISIEKTRFQGNIADIVTIEENKSISIYEVKTNIKCRKNIREALGQLLDYASHARDVKVNKLIIVTPCKLEKGDLDFLGSLKSHVKYDLEYLQFDSNENRIIL